MRLLIIALLVYLLYKLWRGKETENKEQSIFKNQKNPEIEIGEMIQDPVCKIYIPIDQAYKREIKGKECFFCSEKCADIFEKKLREENK